MNRLEQRDKKRLNKNLNNFKRRNRKLTKTNLFSKKSIFLNKKEITNLSEFEYEVNNQITNSPEPNETSNFNDSEKFIRKFSQEFYIPIISN